MKKYALFALALLLGCLALPAVEKVQAGTSCHGKKTKAAPVAVEVDQEVVVGPGVTVRESVEVDGPGNVTVTENVTVGEAPVGAGGPPIGRRASHQAARKVKRAIIAESKAERKEAKAEVKAADASQKAAAEGATAKAFFN